MGGSTGGTGDRSPQHFRRLTLCLWALHGKNRLEMAIVPQSSRHGAALESYNYLNGSGRFTRIWVCIR